LAADVGRRELSADGDRTDTEAEEADRVAEPIRRSVERGELGDEQPTIRDGEVPQPAYSATTAATRNQFDPNAIRRVPPVTSPMPNPAGSALFTVRIVTRMIKTCTSPSVVAGAGHRRFRPSATRVTSA